MTFNSTLLEPSYDYSAEREMHAVGMLVCRIGSEILESVLCNTWTIGWLEGCFTKWAEVLKLTVHRFSACIKAVGRVFGIEEKFGKKCLQLMASNLMQVSSMWECETIVLDCTTWLAFRLAHLLCSNNVFPHISTRRSKVDKWWQVIWIGECIGHYQRYFST